MCFPRSDWSEGSLLTIKTPDANKQCGRSLWRAASGSSDECFVHYNALTRPRMCRNRNTRDLYVKKPPNILHSTWVDKVYVGADNEDCGCLCQWSWLNKGANEVLQQPSRFCAPRAVYCLCHFCNLIKQSKSNSSRNGGGNYPNKSFPLTLKETRNSCPRNKSTYQL